MEIRIRWLNNVLFAPAGDQSQRSIFEHLLDDPELVDRVGVLVTMYGRRNVLCTWPRTDTGFRLAVDHPVTLLKFLRPHVAILTSAMYTYLPPSVMPDRPSAIPPRCGGSYQTGCHDS